ncbi:MAG TPA: hypothetical protein V6C81_14630 [Planktothrix sp.]|jgi:hypothetical protein
MNSPKVSCAALIALAGGTLAWQIVTPLAAGADPFKLDATTNQYNPGASSGNYSYPAPQMVQQAPMSATVRSSPPINLNAQQSYQPPPSRPIQLNATKTQVLPKGYMGSWRVLGQRSKVEAKPEFEQTAQTAFAMTTNNTWTITGSAQGGYTMGNGEMQCAIMVDKIGPDGTAFIRYQHQVGHTMAQEALILTLTNNGMSFNGLERISIVKENEPPRAKITYQLQGQRMR